MLCRSCVDLHRKTKVTQGHSLFDAQVEKDIVCKAHPDEVVRFYCEKCEMCICVVCTFQEHKGHDVSSFTEGIEKYRNSMDSLITLCRERMGYLKEHLHVISKCEHEIKQAEDRIKDTTIDTISAARKKEKELLLQLYDMYGESTTDYLKQKMSLQEKYESMKNTCDLTDIILKDQSIELLLLKKDIHEKLQIMLQRGIPPLPDNINLGVTFQPGHLVFGLLRTGPECQSDSDDTDDDMEDCLSKMCSSVDSQTENVTLTETWTTMEKEIVDFLAEKIIQTESTSCLSRATSPQLQCFEEKSTMTMSKGNHEQSTMTSTKSVMKNETQTDAISHANKETGTSTAVTISKHTNTDNKDTCERSTLTKKTTSVNKITETADLTTCNNKETTTGHVDLISCGTTTHTPDLINRCTNTTVVEQCNRFTTTPRLRTTSTFTMTPVVTMLDMGVTAHVPGEHKSVGTKTTVLTHTAVGRFDVRTVDQSTETVLHISDNQHSNIDKGTAMPHISNATVGTSTCMPKLKNKATGTKQTKHNNKSVEVDMKDLKHEPILQTSESQTSVTFDDDVIIVRRPSCHKESFTDQIEKLEASTETDKLNRCHKKTGTKQVNMVNIAISTVSSHCEDTLKNIMTEDKSCGSFVDTSEHATSIYEVETTDGSHDAYRLDTCDNASNTKWDMTMRPTICKEVNTTKIDVADACISVKTLSTDCSIETDRISKEDNGTSMFSFAQTADANTDMVSTPGIEIATNTLSANVTSKSTSTPRTCTAEKAILTDIASIMSKNLTSITCTTSDSSTRTDERPVTSIGLDPVAVPGVDQSTETITVEHTDTAVGTPIIDHYNQETNTNKIELKEHGTATFVQTLEKATYMPSLVTISTGTSTPTPMMVDKKQNTPVLESVNAATGMPAKRTTSQETNMLSNTTVVDIATGTESVDLVTTGSDAIKPQTCSSSMCTENANTNDNGTSPHCPFMSDATTATHSEDVQMSDEASLTMTPALVDVGIEVNLPRRPPSGTASTMTHIHTCDVGVLKRPHTVSRGISTVVQERGITRATNTRVQQVKDEGTMATNEMKDNTSTTDQVHLVDMAMCTNTPAVVDCSTEMVHLAYTERGSSPVSSSVTDRSCSPVLFAELCNRASSPIMFVGVDQEVDVHVLMDDRACSPIGHNLCDAQTMFEPEDWVMERAVSPVAEFIPPVIKTTCKGTLTETRVFSDRQTSTTKIQLSESSTSTSVETRDRASTPIRLNVEDKGVCARADTSSQSTETNVTTTCDVASSTQKVMTTNSFTSTIKLTLVEKETCTPHIHQMNKNVSTDNMVTADKHTSTIDVGAAYKEAVSSQEQAIVTVNRGTSTPIVKYVTKETSPPRFSMTRDRASSPVRLRTADKGVMARKGEMLAPVDTFQAAGNMQNMPQRLLADTPRYMTLDSIHEDRESQSSDDDRSVVHCKLIQGTAKSFNSDQNTLIHKEKFCTVPSQKHASIFTADVASGAPSSILWKVEMATNTPEVFLETKGTSTPPVEQEDKAICTEAVELDGKMAHCISKLRNVSQRLEQQPVYVQASSNTPKSPLSTSSGEFYLKPNFPQLRSRLIGDKTSSETRGLKKLSSSDSQSESSDAETPKRPTRPLRSRTALARKQRPDLTDMLRSMPSETKSNKEPSILSKPNFQVKTVNTKVLPKLGFEQVKTDSAKDKRQKLRAKMQKLSERQFDPTQGDMRRHSDSSASDGSGKKEARCGRDLEKMPLMSQWSRTLIPPSMKSDAISGVQLSRSPKFRSQKDVSMVKLLLPLSSSTSEDDRRSDKDY